MLIHMRVDYGGWIMVCRGVKKTQWIYQEMRLNFIQPMFGDCDSG